MNKIINSLELIKSSWIIYKKNFNDYLQPILILLIAYALYIMPISIKFPGNDILLTVLTFALIVVSIWISVVFIQISAKLYANEKIDLYAIYKDAFQKSPRYLQFSVLFNLILFGGLILLIIPAIIFFVWFTFVEISISIESKNKKIRNLFSDSKKLSEKRWWATLKRLILPQIFFASIIMIIVISIILVITQGNITIAEINNNAWYNLLFFTVSIITQPLLILPKVILYENLKKS